MPQPSTDTTERLFNLILLLKNTSQPLTFNEIRERISPRYATSGQASRQAFERDKKAIREMNIIIDTITEGGDKAGQMAYRIDPKKNELPNLDLNDAEIEALRVALATARLSDNWAEGALSKLGGEIGQGSGGITGSVIIDVHANGSSLPLVTEAVATRTHLKFDYRGESRKIQPYGVLGRNGHWYVAGLDPSKDAIRTFRLDRMGNPKLTGEPESFLRPSDFDLRKQIPADPKLISDDNGEPDEFAQVLVDIDFAGIVERELGSDAILERRAEGVVFNVPCGNHWAFRSWLFGLVDRAEVIGPAHMRAEVISWLKSVGGAK